MGSPSSACWPYSRLNSNMAQSIPERMAAALSELGLPAPCNIIQTMLMKDRYFVGWKFRYDGGYAILRAEAHTMDFHDEQGTVLKTVAIEEESGAAA